MWFHAVERPNELNEEVACQLEDIWNVRTIKPINTSDTKAIVNYLFVLYGTRQRLDEKNTYFTSYQHIH